MKKPIQIRVDETDLYTWMKLAKESGLGLSAWIRMRCNDVEWKQTGAIKEKEVPAKISKKRDTATGETLIHAGLPKRDSRCPHYKMKGEVCYKCDAKWGYPNLE